MQNRKLINLYHSLGKFIRRLADNIFLIFPRKQDLTLDANPMKTICMECQILISWKNKTNDFYLSGAKRLYPVINFW